MSDRPVSRRLVRLAALLISPAKAHRQDLWPYMSIDRANGVVRWRGKDLLRLDTFDAVVPQRAEVLAVVGSGPSLADQRPEALPPRSTILLNGAASLSARLSPLAIAVEDERFVFRHIDLLRAVPRDVPLLLSPAALRAIAERQADLLANRPVVLIDNLAKPVNGPRRALSDPALDPVLLRGDGGAALSRDPDTGVVIVGTVAFSALQIALAARPAQIILAGIDLSNAAAPRFYETVDDRAPSGLVEGLNRSLAGFALAHDHARATGVALLCASPVSALLSLGIPPTDLLSRQP